MLHSPHDPRLHGCVAMHTQTHGAVYLKVNRTNESGFDRVAKTGKKWRAWVNIDGKQHFLKPSQKDPQEAARSPSCAHQAQATARSANVRRQALNAYPLVLSLLSLRCCRVS